MCGPHARGNELRSTLKTLRNFLARSSRDTRDVYDILVWRRDQRHHRKKKPGKNSRTSSRYSLSTEGVREFRAETTQNMEQANEAETEFRDFSIKTSSELVEIVQNLDETHNSWIIEWASTMIQKRKNVDAINSMLSYSNDEPVCRDFWPL